MASVKQVLPAKAPELKTVRVAAYARVSSGKDAMLHSLSAQISGLRDFIQRRPGWTFAGVYADEALTGTRDDRPEFQRLLRDCREGKIDLIVTKAISRFARNTVTLLKTTRELKELGISVYFQKEGIYSDRGQGEMILTLLAAVAQEESRAVSDNCKWRIHNRFKNGELVNLRFLYGYKVKKGSIEIEPFEAQVVRDVFQAYLAGQGCAAIARSLIARGVQTTFGGEWTANRVMVMLKNEKYAGNALLQKKFVINHITKKETLNRGQLPRYSALGTHPAIIELEVFDEAQRLIEVNRARNNVSTATPATYPFTGKIECGNCEKFFRRGAFHGKPKWSCATYLRKGRDACPAKQIPEETLQEIAAHVLDTATFDADAFEASIVKVLVTGQTALRFIFRDGREKEATWNNRSRSASWTAEMKQVARERNLRKGNTPCKQPA